MIDNHISFPMEVQQALCWL